MQSGILKSRQELVVMESGTVTVGDCCENVSIGSICFGCSASSGSILNTPGRLKEVDTKITPIVGCVNCHIVTVESGLASFTLCRRSDAMPNSPNLLIPADNPSSSDLCLGKDEARDEIASRVAGGPVAVQAFAVRGLPQPSPQIYAGSMSSWKF